MGAIYAAGYSPEEMIARFQQLDQSHLYGRQPGDGPSLLGVAGLNQLLKDMLGERTFDDLKIPCALTAVDLVTEKEVILKMRPGSRCSAGNKRITRHISTQKLGTIFACRWRLVGSRARSPRVYWLPICRLSL